MGHLDNILVNDLFEGPCFSCQSHLEIETSFVAYCLLCAQTCIIYSCHSYLMESSLGKELALRLMSTQ